MLTSNERLLAAGIRDADRAMAEAQERAVPGVDEVLVAPTVVGSQLWNLCAEEAGIAEALYCLGRGLDAGRIGAEAFVKVCLISILEICSLVDFDPESSGC